MPGIPYVGSVLRKVGLLTPRGLSVDDVNEEARENNISIYDICISYDLFKFFETVSSGFHC